MNPDKKMNLMYGVALAAVSGSCLWGYFQRPNRPELGLLKSTSQYIKDNRYAADPKIIQQALTTVSLAASMNPDLAELPPILTELKGLASLTNAYASTSSNTTEQVRMLHQVSGKLESVVTNHKPLVPLMVTGCLTGFVSVYMLLGAAGRREEDCYVITGPEMDLTEFKKK